MAEQLPACKFWAGVRDSGPTGADQQTWKVVWCSEHCFKAAHDGYRGRLAEQVRACGGRLVCLKKAAGFAEWAAEQGRDTKYFLLASWREAKGCWQLCHQQGDMPRPIASWVICESPTTMGRASSWLESNLVSCCPVSLCLDITATGPFVRNLWAKVLEMTETSVQTTSTNGSGTEGKLVPPGLSVAPQFGLMGAGLPRPPAPPGRWDLCLPLGLVGAGAQIQMVAPLHRLDQISITVVRQEGSPLGGKQCEAGVDVALPTYLLAHLGEPCDRVVFSL